MAFQYKFNLLWISNLCFSMTEILFKVITLFAEEEPQNAFASMNCTKKENIASQT